ncbi:MAG: Gfo/Idh/MocA family oxidoreductase [Firmicutes bacterium]|nr:Gfo/Idh/MocA family oxidoreductase [Bacillota bacterium]
MVKGREMQSNEGTLRYGMVGGGPGAFIGDVHRKAASFDGKAQLVAGVFSRNYENTLATGRALGISPDRLYRDFEEMAQGEAAREDGIDFVSIVAPNHAHYPAAKAFLTSGIHVVCDKPLTFTVEEAEDLARIARGKDLLFGVTYTYSGYPMVKQAREMVRRGDIGEIRVVMGEYLQEWLAAPIEKDGQKQAVWRLDPRQSGGSACVGDIGSHIENTVSYITGLKIKSICANLDIFGEGRELDDNAEILVKYDNGASGIYWCSQVAIGHENGLKIRIVGTKGSIEWEQENPNYLRVAYLGQPAQILSRGAGYLYPQAARFSRVPVGHPEGFYEAFANIYSAFAGALLKRKAGQPLSAGDLDFPDVEAGVAGVRFINRCIESSKKGCVWVSMD